MRSDRRKPSGELASVNQGHHDVGQQQIDGTGRTLTFLERLRAIAGFEHMVSGVRQRFAKHVSERRFVLHQQDGFATTAGAIVCRRRGYFQGRCLRELGQVNGKGSAF